MNTAPINPDHDTPHTYGLVKSWMSECQNRHGKRRPVFDQGPSRLLRIRKLADGYNLMLLDNADTHLMDYVALSYCWGGDQPYMTPKASYDSTGTIIPYGKLPQTLQDAIKVTTELGYSCIWVDSLCIIQDCPMDKSREIAKMPSIYNNAIVTIAAATAASTLEGFLQKRTTTRPIISNVRFQDGTLQVHDGGMVQLDTYRCGTLPLHSRA